MAVENTLKKIRKSHNDTQKDLAIAVGVDTKTIKNIENNGGGCSLEVAIRLSEHYDIYVNNIFSVAKS